MSKVCPVTGKRPLTGNRVSHANNKTRRIFEPNMQSKRLWSPALGRFVKLRISAKGLKIISMQETGAAQDVSNTAKQWNGQDKL